MTKVAVCGTDEGKVVGGTDGDRAVGRQPPRHSRYAAAIEAELRADPNRTNQAIANIVGCKRGQVSKKRHQLIARGEIEGETERAVEKYSKRHYRYSKRPAIEAELRADPSRSNRLIAAIVGTHHSIVFEVRHALIAAGEIANAPPTQFQLTNPASQNQPNKRPGARIHLTADKTIASAVHEAIALEAQGIPLQRAAEQAGLTRHYFSMASAVVLLSERTDLGPFDRAKAAAALEQMETTRQIPAAYQIIKNIAERVWGFRSQKTNRNEHRRRERANTALCIIEQVCSDGATLDLPHVDVGTAQTYREQVDAAIKNLKRLYRRLKEIHP